MKPFNYAALLVALTLGLAAPKLSGAQLVNRIKSKVGNSINKIDRSSTQAAKKEKSDNNEPPAENDRITHETQVNEQKPVATYSKFDFIPGDKIIYAEDFSQDNIGELPVSWNTAANGVLVTMDDENEKWLKLASGTYLSGNKSKGFGKDFTIEFDLLLNVVPQTGYYLPPLAFGVFASGNEDPGANNFLTHRNNLNAFEIKIDPKANQLTMAELKSYEKGAETFRNPAKQIPGFGSTIRKVAHYAVAVQGTRLRVWINEEKAFDVPRAVNTSSVLNQIYFRTELTAGYTDDSFSYLLSNIKVATGAPDTRSRLVTDGKWSTTGILFDVNSAVIKASSHGTLKEIAGVLKENESLNVKIIGHTDNDGSASSNLELSRKRAKAVKEFLISYFSIAAGRITTDGMGASQPLSDNNSREGKANNRRVEFVRM